MPWRGDLARAGGSGQRADADGLDATLPRGKMGEFGGAFRGDVGHGAGPGDRLAVVERFLGGGGLGVGGWCDFGRRGGWAAGFVRRGGLGLADEGCVRMVETSWAGEGVSSGDWLAAVAAPGWPTLGGMAARWDERLRALALPRSFSFIDRDRSSGADRRRLSRAVRAKPRICAMRRGCRLLRGRRRWPVRGEARRGRTGAWQQGEEDA